MSCQGATRGGRTESITWTSETMENQAWRGSAQSSLFFLAPSRRFSAKQSILPARLHLSQWIQSMKKCFGMCELVEEEDYLLKKDI